jgi:hypothetical protein
MLLNSEDQELLCQCGGGKKHFWILEARLFKPFQSGMVSLRKQQPPQGEIGAGMVG